MASDPEHDDEAPSLASRVLDLLDDDLLGVAEQSEGNVLPETASGADTPEEVQATPEEPLPEPVPVDEPLHEPPEVMPEPSPSPPEGDEEDAPEPVESSPAAPPKEGRKGRKFKPKGMYLGGGVPPTSLWTSIQPSWPVTPPCSEARAAGRR